LATDEHRWSPIQKENKLFNQCLSVSHRWLKLLPVLSSYLGVLGVLAVAFSERGPDQARSAKNPATDFPYHSLTIDGTFAASCTATTSGAGGSSGRCA
jgi:hypothetical protein